MTFGERVKNKRLALGLSQAELAKRSGYGDRFAISKIERGHVVKQSTVVKLAKALGVTPSYLMGWVDEEGNEIVEETPLERLKRETGVTEFSEEEKKEILKYIKYLISLREK